MTLQIHRTNVMRKMEAESLADLVRMAGWLNIPPSQAPSYCTAGNPQFPLADRFGSGINVTPAFPHQRRSELSFFAARAANSSARDTNRLSNGDVLDLL